MRDLALRVYRRLSYIHLSLVFIFFSEGVLIHFHLCITVIREVLLAPPI